MEPQILLAQLRALLERAPSFENFSASSRDQQQWLGQAHALIVRWNSLEASSFKINCGCLSLSSTKEMALSQIFGAIFRAISDLELKVPSEIEVSFGAGDVYSFFKALNSVIATAEKSIFVVDPYLDESVFDHYLNSRSSNVSVRLMLNHKAENLKPACEKYNLQFGNVLEIRKSNLLHDRVVFIDGYVCWLLGQSVKDAAKAKPTYLVQLPPDVVPNKLKSYEEIWQKAVVL